MRQLPHGNDVTVEISAAKLEEEDNPEDVAHVVEGEAATGDVAPRPHLGHVGPGDQSSQVHLGEDYVLVPLKVLRHCAENRLVADHYDDLIKNITILIPSFFFTG